MPLLPMLLAQVANVGGAAQQNLNPIQKFLGNNSFTNGIVPPLLMMFAVFYFLVLRPQQRKQSDHETWQKKLVQGDEVVTNGGLVGKITHVTEDILTIEVGEKVRVRVLRTHVAGPRPGAAPVAASAKDAPAKDKASA